MASPRASLSEHATSSRCAPKEGFLDYAVSTYNPVRFINQLTLNSFLTPGAFPAVFICGTDSPAPPHELSMPPPGCWPWFIMGGISEPLPTPSIEELSWGSGGGKWVGGGPPGARLMPVMLGGGGGPPLVRRGVPRDIIDWVWRHKEALIRLRHVVNSQTHQHLCCTQNQSCQISIKLDLANERHSKFG